MKILQLVQMILTLVGSLGLFLFGMKLMSEALQKVAGKRLRHFLSTVTSGNIRGLFTGIVVTAAIQSSSASTVMLVSFVNAGLISVYESIAVVMGANIGTTITGWIISLLGFRFNLSEFLLPLAAIALPMMFFSAGKNRQSWGEFMIGFVILFLGLYFLKENMPAVNEQSGLLGIMPGSDRGSFLTFISFMTLGLILTMIFQSSSAMMAFTFVLATNGWVSFSAGAAMVLGENLGTTITAILASLVANRPAKRTAIAHFLFNLVGILWASILFRPFLDAVNLIMIQTGQNSPFTTIPAIPLSLALFHTLFNTINTLIFIGFTRNINRLLGKLIPITEEEEELYRLKFFSTGLLSISELSLVQSRREIGQFANRVHRMFGLLPELLMEKGQKKYIRILDRIRKYEQIADNIELEIAQYLTRLSESNLSKDGSIRLRNMLKIIDHLENIADTCNIMADIIDRKNQQNVWFNQEMRNNLFSYFEEVNQAFQMMKKGFESDSGENAQEMMNMLKSKMDNLRDQFLEENRIQIKKGAYSYQNGTFYADLITQISLIGDLIVTIYHSLREK